MREYFIATSGLAGAAIAYTLGGWDTALQTLVIFMAADYVSGVILAGVFKRSKHGSGTQSHGCPPTTGHPAGLSSSRCWRGLAKKGMQLVLVLAGHRLDMVLGTDFVRTAVIIAFISSEVLSLTENAALMGIPVPPAIRKALDVLNTREKA